MTYKFITTKERSCLMRRIKSSNTSPEIILRKNLRANGISFGIGDFGLPGHPDIIIKKHKLAIFIDGEFWHGYKWREKKSRLKANRAYWIPKIEKTILRDRKNNKILKKTGWKVIRLWQHQINEDLPKCIKQIINKMPDSQK